MARTVALALLLVAIVTPFTSANDLPDLPDSIIQQNGKSISGNFAWGGKKVDQASTALVANDMDLSKYAVFGKGVDFGKGGAIDQAGTAVSVNVNKDGHGNGDVRQHSVSIVKNTADLPTGFKLGEDHIKQNGVAFSSNVNNGAGSNVDQKSVAIVSNNVDLAKKGGRKML